METKMKKLILVFLLLTSCGNVVIVPEGSQIIIRETVTKVVTNIIEESITSEDKGVPTSLEGDYPYAYKIQEKRVWMEDQWQGYAGILVDGKWKPTAIWSTHGGYIFKYSRDLSTVDKCYAGGVEAELYLQAIHPKLTDDELYGSNGLLEKVAIVARGTYHVDVPLTYAGYTSSYLEAERILNK